MPEHNLRPIPTIEEAEAEVWAEWEEERKKALNFFARQKVARVEELHRRAEREEEQRRKREAEAAEAAKLARKAWVRIFGRKLADQLDPWAEYELIPWEGKHVAVLSENAETTRALATQAGLDTQTGEEHVGVRGIYVTRFVTELAGVDPTPEQITAVGERKAEAQRSERESQRKRNEREAQLQRERDLLGVTVSG